MAFYFTENVWAINGEGQKQEAVNAFRRNSQPSFMNKYHSFPTQDNS
jgi:hypothetical protein